MDIQASEEGKVTQIPTSWLSNKKVNIHAQQLYAKIKWASLMQVVKFLRIQKASISNLDFPALIYTSIQQISGIVLV